MNILTNSISENEIRITIEGRVDSITAPKLRKTLFSLPDSITKVVFDFNEVQYISPAGLRELLIWRKRFGGDSMLVDNVRPEVFESFHTIGFDSLIPIRRYKYDDSDYSYMSYKEFFAMKAAQVPDRVFLIDKNDSYTWSDIDKGSQIIAKDLAAMGVTRKDHVVLCGVNSVNWIMSFIAIQKLGAMALLINPVQLPEEIGTTATTGDAAYIIYGELPEMKDKEQFLDRLCAASNLSRSRLYDISDKLLMKERFDEYDEISGRFAQHEEAEDVSVMIFTSGSTNVPKGVLLSSYNVLNASRDVQSSVIRMESSDRLCLILPLFHIFGLIAGIFICALADSVVYLPSDIHTDTLLELIYREKCTAFHSVPTMLIALINNKDFNPDKVKTLRCTIISGAAATGPQVEMFQKVFPDVRFIAAYGLSEMAPVSITGYKDTYEHLSYTGGRPIDKIEILIQNPATKEACRQGETGEVLVQGFNLTCAYYKLPLDDQPVDEQGWFHTGDLGYLTDDGYLCLSGRMKELIIRGGENIMPSAVENVISGYEAVDNVKVVGVPNDFLGEEVAAAIRLKKGAKADLDDLREWLSTRLAKYMIPSRIEIFDELPVLGTGKIDGAAVRESIIRRIKGDEQD